jgi:hypothetical protein
MTRDWSGMVLNGRGRPEHNAEPAKIAKGAKMEGGGAHGASHGRGVALGGLEAYHRTKAGKHWVILRSHPYRSPYQGVPGVPAGKSKV